MALNHCWYMKEYLCFCNTDYLHFNISPAILQNDSNTKVVWEKVIFCLALSSPRNVQQKVKQIGLMKYAGA